MCPGACGILLRVGKDVSGSVLSLRASMGVAGSARQSKEKGHNSVWLQVRSKGASQARRGRKSSGRFSLDFVLGRRPPLRRALMKGWSVLI